MTEAECVVTDPVSDEVHLTSPGPGQKPLERKRPARQVYPVKLNTTNSSRLNDPTLRGKGEKKVKVYVQCEHNGETALPTVLIYLYPASGDAKPRGPPRPVTP